MSQWQPIETAPKDGTPIMVAGGHDDHLRYARDEKESRFMKAPARVAWLANDWILSICEAGCVTTTYENPTHWMPLPAPPHGRG